MDENRREILMLMDQLEATMLHILELSPGAGWVFIMEVQRRVLRVSAGMEEGRAS